MFNFTFTSGLSLLFFLSIYFQFHARYDLPDVFCFSYYYSPVSLTTVRSVIHHVRFLCIHVKRSTFLPIYLCVPLGFLFKHSQRREVSEACGTTAGCTDRPPFSDGRAEGRYSRLNCLPNFSLPFLFCSWLNLRELRLHLLSYLLFSSWSLLSDLETDCWTLVYLCQYIYICMHLYLLASSALLSGSRWSASIFLCKFSSVSLSYLHPYVSLSSIIIKRTLVVSFLPS